MIVDISQEILSGKVFSGDPVPVSRLVKSIDHGDGYNLTEFSMCAHNGTHIDAPRHFISDGAAVDGLGLKPFIGECFTARRSGALTADDVIVIMEQARENDASSRIIIAGEAIITVEAARAFSQAGISLLGVESQSVGSGDDTADVHRILLGAGVILLEGLVLTDVTEGKWFLSAAPLNIAGSDGAPCRAVLIR